MSSLIFIFGMGVLARLSGNGFGAKWGVSWLPEGLFAIPIGVALGISLPESWGLYAALVGGLAVGWSYIFMQSATWMFLQWTEHEPNRLRKSTLKPVVDWIAARFGYELGDEGYSWIAAGVKGFLIGLPVGGIPLAILWPLGYEIGSHAEGRVEKFGIDPHAVSEFLAGCGAGIAVLLFISLVY